MADDQQDDMVDSTPESRNAKGQWNKGVSGNPNGPKRKWFREAFIKHFEDNPGDFKAIIAEIIAAGKGLQTNRFSETVNQAAAAQFIKETLDGRAKQEVEVTGEDGGPLTIKIVEED